MNTSPLHPRTSTLFLLERQGIHNHIHIITNTLHSLWDNATLKNEVAIHDAIPFYVMMRKSCSLPASDDDSVCFGGTMERTRRTARPRTAGTAYSSCSVGVPSDFSLEASKAPVLFHQKWCFLGCLLVLAWGETTNRTMADGREWYSCRTIRCGSGSWQDCGAGLWNRRQAHGVLAVWKAVFL